MTYEISSKLKFWKINTEREEAVKNEVNQAAKKLASANVDHERAVKVYENQLQEAHQRAGKLESQLQVYCFG